MDISALLASFYSYIILGYFEKVTRTVEDYINAAILDIGESHAWVNQILNISALSDIPNVPDNLVHVIAKIL